MNLHRFASSLSSKYGQSQLKYSDFYSEDDMVDFVQAAKETINKLIELYSEKIAKNIPIDKKNQFLELVDALLQMEEMSTSFKERIASLYCERYFLREFAFKGSNASVQSNAPNELSALFDKANNEIDHCSDRFDQELEKAKHLFCLAIIEAQKTLGLQETTSNRIEVSFRPNGEQKVYKDNLQSMEYYFHNQMDNKIIEYIGAENLYKNPNMAANLYFKQSKASHIFFDPYFSLMFHAMYLKQDEIDAWTATYAHFLDPIAHMDWQNKKGSAGLYVYAIDGQDMYIFSRTKPDLDMKVVSEDYLPAVGRIPPVFFTYGRIGAGAVVPEFAASKLVSENAFLIPVGEAMFNFTPSDEARTKMLEGFILKNKKAIDRLHSMFGNNPKLLGKGSDGVAFQINNHQVIKFLTNAYAYQEAVKAMNRIHDEPEVAKTEAMIYECGEVGKWASKTLYYVVLEKMTPVWDFNTARKPMQDLIKYIIAETEGIPEWMGKLKKAMAEKRDVQKVMSHILLRMIWNVENFKSVEIKKIEKEMPDLREDWLPSFLEEIVMKSVTNRKDLHLGNLGVTSYGDLRYFDPAYEKYQSKFNEWAMNQTVDSF